MIKTCPVCGKQFETTGSKNYCSNGCRYAGRTEPDGRGTMAECPICGKTITGVKHARRYCDNPECRREGNRRTKALALEKRELVCVCCGKEFRRSNPVMYCSKKCRLADAARRRKELEEQIRGTPVRLKVLKPVDVYVSMRPEVGKIYDGLLYKSISRDADTLVIPEIGKLGLIVRKDEVEIVG